jgi:hypothetical protein
VLLHFDKSEDVTHLLQTLWQLAFDRDSAQFTKAILSELENDESWITERLAKSLWLTPEFEVRMLPAIKQAFAQESYSDERRKKLDGRIAELVAAGAKPKEAVATPTRIKDLLESLEKDSGLSTAFKDPWPAIKHTDLYLPTHRSIEWLGWGPTLWVALSVVGTLLINVFLYKRDLPPAATLSQAIKSRLVLFFADFSIVATISLVIRQVQQDTNRIFSTKYSPVSYKTRSISWSSIISYVPLLGVSLFYVHIESLGPLSFLNQVFLFLINLYASWLLSIYVIEMLPSD